MNYLKDTCVFIKNIYDSKKILDTASHCKAIGSRFCTTDIVIEELIPGRHVPMDKAKTSMDIKQGLQKCSQYKIIDIYNTKLDEKYKKNFDTIRMRYYGHLKDKESVKEAIKSGDLTIEQVKNKSYLQKDYGECSCIAVAIEDPNNYIIVSNDKGRIFLKPRINLFEKYSRTHNVKVWDFNEWVKNTNYNPEEYSIVNE